MSLFYINFLNLRFWRYNRINFIAFEQLLDTQAMLFQKETNQAGVVIKAYEPGSIRLNIGVFNSPVLLVNGEKQDYVGPECYQDITSESLLANLQELPEVMIIGTGSSHHLLPIAITKALNNKGVAIESMASREACHTYQVLTFEQRRVCALIFP